MLTVSSLPAPVWPVVVLALIHLVDGALCVRPIPPIARCLTDVAWPRPFWWAIPATKFAAGAGLLLGIVVPWLGTAAALGTVCYFVTAIVLHVRARDLGRNLFLNATGMLVVSVAVLVLSFVGYLPA